MCIRDRYKLTPPKMEIMRNQINKLLEQQVIEPSTSPYSSPAFLVPKGTDKHRLVVDYRQLKLGTYSKMFSFTAVFVFTLCLKGKSKIILLFYVKIAPSHIPLLNSSR